MSLKMICECFKPEIQKGGEDYFRKDLVYLSIAADTQVQAFVKVSNGVRVLLKSQAISSTEAEAICSCPGFSRGQLCKHIWATLLAVEKKHPDFLESKETIFAMKIEESSALKERKAKQREFKETQSARVKENNKRQRLEKKKQKQSARESDPSYPPAVQAALDYFDQNGFPRKELLNGKGIQLAKKKLSYIFHPDKGGTHEEILTLNHYSEVLLKSLAVTE
jgi:hypothetical protein